MPKSKLTRDDLRHAAEKYKNWGKWGATDEVGTLNYTQPEDIIAAARLVKKGKVIHAMGWTRTRILRKQYVEWL